MYCSCCCTLLHPTKNFFILAASHRRQSPHCMSHCGRSVCHGTRCKRPCADSDRPLYALMLSATTAHDQFTQGRRSSGVDHRLPQWSYQPGLQDYFVPICSTVATHRCCSACHHLPLHMGLLLRAVQFFLVVCLPFHLPLLFAATRLSCSLDYLLPDRLVICIYT